MLSKYEFRPRAASGNTAFSFCLAKGWTNPKGQQPEEHPPGRLVRRLACAFETSSKPVVLRLDVTDCHLAYLKCA